MRLSNRQYFYIAAIIALAIYNGVRFYRARHAAPSAAGSAVHLRVDKGTSPVWTLYEQAAGLRDAAAPAFQPALENLNHGLETISPPLTPSAEVPDLQGCKTWLLFYRQEFLHPSINKPGWRDQTLQHVLSCAINHRDDAK